MKSLITKVFAALLVGWYLVGVIGFGVHTCSGSGRSFIVSFLEDMDCAAIHPGHRCDPASCCAHAHCEKGCCGHDDGSHHVLFSLLADSCCSNDYQMLDLTGTLSSDDDCDDARYVLDHGLYAGRFTDFLVASNECISIITRIHEPDSGVDGACDRQAVLSVWRI